MHEFVIPRERSPDDEFEIVGARCKEGAGPVPLNAIHTTLVNHSKCKVQLGLQVKKALQKNSIAIYLMTLQGSLKV